MTEVIEKLYEMSQRLERIEKLGLMDAKEILTVEETALLMGCSADHVYRLTSGTSPVIGYSKPNGKDKYIEKKEVMAYMRRNRVKGSIEIEDEAKQYEKRR